MIFRHLLNMRSHPTWVRGLKLYGNYATQTSYVSHPTWVRGLKLFAVVCLNGSQQSHPTWVRGLKPPVLLPQWFPLPGRTLRGCVD